MWASASVEGKCGKKLFGTFIVSRVLFTCWKVTQKVLRHDVFKISNSDYSKFMFCYQNINPYAPDPPSLIIINNLKMTSSNFIFIIDRRQPIILLFSYYFFYATIRRINKDVYSW